MNKKRRIFFQNFAILFFFQNKFEFFYEKVLARQKKLCYYKFRSLRYISERENATVVQLVVRHLAKVEVAGSSPVCRSSKKPVNNRMHALRAFYCHE